MGEIERWKDEAAKFHRLAMDHADRTEAAERQRDMLAEALRECGKCVDRFATDLSYSGNDLIEDLRSYIETEALARASQPPAAAPTDAAQERDDA